MSIVLKTDPKQIPDFIECLNYDTHFTGKLMREILHDLAYAHAMQMAIEELEYSFRKALNERAAANLARLMGEGND